MDYRVITVFCAGMMCLILGGPAAFAQGAATTKGNITATEEMANAREVVQEAADVVQHLRADPEIQRMLKSAKGVFIVSDYGRAAFGVGGSGGQGVLVANNQGQWSPPAFYNIGTISAGLEAGAEGGSIAFLLMSDDALDGFRKENNFSLNADAGLTIINWSNRAQASAGKPDVIVWSDTAGLYGDLAITATDIFWDEEANRAYYQKTASARKIINGKVQVPESAKALQSEFSALETGESTGGGREGEE